MDIEERAKQIAEEIGENDSAKEKTQENNLPSTSSEDISLKGLNNEFLKKQVEMGNSLQDITTDYAKSITIGQIFDDDSEEGQKYRKELADEQKDTLKESYKQDKVKEKTKTISEKQKKAEAFYKSFRPILEFDFDNLIKRKVNKEDDKIKKTYDDRSYGISLMVLMLILLTIPYCFVTIFLAGLNGLNAILEEINTFGKIAKWIALSLLIIVFALLLIYGAILGIESIFGVTIIPH
jgi:hypothetical protein